jgi:hypothetical protein
MHAATCRSVGSTTIYLKDSMSIDPNLSLKCLEMIKKETTDLYVGTS